MRLALPLAAVLAVLAALAIPAVAAAQTVIPVGKFTGVELHGGGKITIRQGPVQRVTLVQGDPSVAHFEVDGHGRLIAMPCRGSCWGPHRFEVEIETPVLDAIAIHGGGHITAHGAFPPEPQVSVAIHGGGDIDMRDVPAQSASASIMGGGKIYVAAQNKLDASIFGGGVIRYLGHPAVNSAVHGGGSVSPLE